MDRDDEMYKAHVALYKKLEPLQYSNRYDALADVLPCVVGTDNRPNAEILADMRRAAADIQLDISIRLADVIRTAEAMLPTN